MKTSEFEKIIKETPQYKARFKLIKIPKWLKLSNNNHISYGRDFKNQFYLYSPDGRMIPEKQPGHNLHPYPSQFKFVNYIKVN